MGVMAERITEPGAVRPALEKAMANGGPNLLDIMVDRSV
jgi:thiamine pyrophosphate-dependent acetolactate synthase large subunit-like protein